MDQIVTFPLPKEVKRNAAWITKWDSPAKYLPGLWIAHRGLD